MSDAAVLGDVVGASEKRSEHIPLPAVAFRLVLKAVRQARRITRKLPAWTRDAVGLVSLVTALDILPTLLAVALVPRHFFRRLPEIIQGRRSPYATPVKFFIVGTLVLVTLKVASLYQIALFAMLEEPWLIESPQSLEIAASAWAQQELHAFSAYTGIGWLKQAGPSVVLWSGYVVGVVLTPLWVIALAAVTYTTIQVAFLFGHTFPRTRPRVTRHLLVALDWRTYRELDWSRYAWGVLYFSIYLAVLFPVIILTFVGPPASQGFSQSSRSAVGAILFWLFCAAVALVIIPYNELLIAAGRKPTPLMARNETFGIVRLLRLGWSFDQWNAANRRWFANVLAAECRALAVGEAWSKRQADCAGRDAIKEVAECRVLYRPRLDLAPLTAVLREEDVEEHVRIRISECMERLRRLSGEEHPLPQGERQLGRVAFGVTTTLLLLVLFVALQ